MLPTNFDTDTAPDAGETAERVSALMAEKGMSLSTVARQTDISRASLSLFLKGDLPTDPVEMAGRLHRWLESQRDADAARGRLHKLRQFSLTPTSAAIQKVMRNCQLLGEFGVVAGASGIGKTFSCVNYRSSNPNVWYMDFSPVSGSKSAVVRHIAQALEINADGYRGNYLLLQKITRYLKDRRALLIADEAQHLDKPGIETFRWLTNHWGMGVVLCGHMELTDKVTAITAAAGRAAFQTLRILNAQPQDADAIFAGWDFLDKPSCEFLREKAAGRYGLRHVVTIVRASMGIAEKRGLPISLEIIREASRSVMPDAFVSAAA